MPDLVTGSKQQALQTLRGYAGNRSQLLQLDNIKLLKAQEASWSQNRMDQEQEERGSNLTGKGQLSRGLTKWKVDRRTQAEKRGRHFRAGRSKQISPRGPGVCSQPWHRLTTLLPLMCSAATSPESTVGLPSLSLFFTVFSPLASSCGMNTKMQFQVNY